MILIVGAAGFIGINLAIRLLKQNLKVIGVDNFLTGSEERLKIISSNPNFTFHKADISNKDIIKKLDQYKFDQIYHLACPTGVPNLELLSEEMVLATSQGTEFVLEIAKKNRSKFLYASSSEVYGDPLIFPQTEEYTGNVDPTSIRSVYEEGKRFSETITEMFVRKYGLDAKIIRIFNTYGPYFSEKDQRAIPQFIMRALKNEPLLVHGDGRQKRTFLYIEDLLEGFFIAMNDNNPGAVYNIGSRKEYEIIDVAKLIVKLTNSYSKIVFDGRAEHDINKRMPSVEKIQSLGWKEKVSLEEGIKNILKGNY